MALVEGPSRESSLILTACLVCKIAGWAGGAERNANILIIMRGDIMRYIEKYNISEDISLEV